MQKNLTDTDLALKLIRGLMSKEKRFSEEIAELLLDKIKEWGLAKGDKLPSHSSIAKELQVSLPSLREGLELLALSGVISISHGSGTVVSEPEPSDYFRILDLASRIKPVDIGEISDFLKFFSSAFCSSLAVPPAEILKPLEYLCSLDDRTAGSIFLEAFGQFHYSLSALTGNVFIKEAYLVGINLFLTHPSMKELSAGAVASFLAVHRNLQKGIKEGNKSEFGKLLQECYNPDPLLKEKIDFVYESFGSGSPGGSFYSIASRIAKIINEKSTVNIQVELTGGGVDNIELTEKGKTILGLTQSDIADSAFRGKGIFKKEYSHLRAVCRMRPLDLWIFSRESSGIDSLYDLKGRRVAMGAAGGDSSIISRRIIEKLGFEAGDYRAYFLPISHAMDGLFRDEIDMVFYFSCGVPVIVNQYTERIRFKLTGVPEEVISAMEDENSYWKRSEISFPGESIKVQTISVSTLLITGTWVSEALVYSITKGLIENCGEIDTRFFTNQDEISIPLHKGAGKALREALNV